MSNVKYIYWFTYYNLDAPSVRYRAKYPLNFFKKNYGVKSTLIIPGYDRKRMFSFIKSYCSALFFRKEKSVIVIQRVHSNFIYSTLLKLLVIVRKKDTVYDLDDADYLYCRPNSIYFFAKKCARLSLGSQEISNHLSRFNSTILITTSPTPDMKIIKQKKSDIFTIGWVGGFAGDHKKSMIEIVFPAINQLNFECKFILLGVTHAKDEEFVKKYFNKNKNIQLEIPAKINWLNEAELQHKIMSFDIGIATLIDNEIQRSKSGIKAKQYLNNGVPVLGTDLPENNRVIKNEINGFFCSNTKEFHQRIVEFHEMSDEQYSSFLKNARDSIKEFNLEKYYADFILFDKSNDG